MAREQGSRGRTLASASAGSEQGQRCSGPGAEAGPADRAVGQAGLGPPPQSRGCPGRQQESGMSEKRSFLPPSPPPPPPHGPASHLWPTGLQAGLRLSDRVETPSPQVPCKPRGVQEPRIRHVLGGTGCLLSPLGSAPRPVLRITPQAPPEIHSEPGPAPKAPQNHSSGHTLVMAERDRGVVPCDLGELGCLLVPQLPHLLLRSGLGRHGPPRARVQWQSPPEASGQRAGSRAMGHRVDVLKAWLWAAPHSGPPLPELPPPGSPPPPAVVPSPHFLRL